MANSHRGKKKSHYMYFTRNIMDTCILRIRTTKYLIFPFHEKYYYNRGAGFIGTNLCLRLLKEKPQKIYLIDNLMRTQGLRNIIDNPKVEFIYGDACIFDFTQLGEISHFFHLASPKINRCVKYNLEGHQKYYSIRF